MNHMNPSIRTPLSIPADSPALQHIPVAQISRKEMGRIRHHANVCHLGYSASEISFLCDGALLAADFITDDFCREETLKAWIGILVEEDTEPWLRFPLERDGEYLLFDRGQYAAWKGTSAEALPRQLSIRIIKYSEAAFGVTGIRWLLAPEGTSFSALPAKPRKIEYIGDSITCGYGVEGVVERDVFTTTQENPFQSFSVRSAQLLDADYQLVSWSGIGLVTDYIPPEVDEPLKEVLIQELYPYTNLRLDTRLNIEPEPWDFSRFRPDAVVINIGTNDASYTRSKPEREALYVEEYRRLLSFIREKYGAVEIFCAYGIMDQTLCPALEKLVTSLQKEGDSHIHYVYFPLQLDEDGIGADFHPSPVTHAKAADKLADAVREILGW